MKTDYEKLAEMIQDIQFTMMTTLDNGKMHSRPMATMKLDKNFDGTLWFFTRLDAPKVHEIEEEKDVSLAYSEPASQRYTAVYGVATISRDKAKMKELWTPPLKAWFPEGLEDPQLTLIRVDVESAEIWDSPPSKVVKLVGMAKAMMTGKPYDHAGDHRQMNLKSH